jgi:hypothetical protein
MIGIVRRISLVAAAGLLLPACGKDFKSGSQLFLEGFNGTFPGTSWTTPVTTGTPTVATAGTTGSPAPSLEMTTTTATASARTETVLAFSNPNVTLSVNMAAQSSATTEIGTGTVSILDSTPAAVAFASWNNATNLITFSIIGGSADQTVAVTADSTFHRLTFNVSATGTASWSIDNQAPLVTRAAFPPGPLKVELGSTFGAGTAWPSFFFDLVNVTSP